MAFSAPVAWPGARGPGCPPGGRSWYVQAVIDAARSFASTQVADRLIQEYGPETVTQTLRPLLTDERIERIEAVLDARLSGLTVALENLHDPHNGAAAIRSLEAIGLTTLHVSESAEEFRYSAGITIGCEKWIDVVRHPDFDTCARTLHQAGFCLYAACPGAEYDLESIDTSRPTAVVFGNELQGLSDRARTLCEGSVVIPMHGFTRSFNLSVSVALAMHRLAARRRHSLGRPGDLDDKKRDLLRARWYALGVRGAEAILTRFRGKADTIVCAADG
jgi:tRNA (guanosine-2'-O-)-methyltransferase